MTLGRRIDERRKEIGISQAELARRVEMRQSTLNALINGESRSSRKIVQLARELETTAAYLVGETPDPDAGAAPKPPQVIQHVTMSVALPSENALADMFEGLLLAIDREQPVDGIARELAQLLPTGLSQLQGRLIELPRPPRTRSAEQAFAQPEDAEAPASADRERVR